MRISIRLISAILFLYVFPCVGHAQDIVGQWEKYLAAQEQVNHFMGSVLIAQRGKPLLRKAFGLANVEHDVPNKPHTKFRLGSLTKQFTAAAILILQDRGLLNVQDSIDKYIENAPMSWKDVTIHHLLNHKSGIPSFTNFTDYIETCMIPSRPDKTMLRFKDKPLEFAPGTKFAYSNSGYILLAMIIESVSGLRYEDFLRHSIFDSLGMNDSGHDTFTAILKNRASGYTLDNNELLHSPYCDMDLPIGGGDLYSTVDDMLKWDKALYKNQILSNESRIAMFTPNEVGYGYGWGISKMFGRVIHAHAGGINGFAAQIIRFPEEDILVVILSNQENSPVMQIGRDLVAILFAKKYDLPKPDSLQSKD
jgi:CubicO group peptidase (beta-lactamase class C family)